MDLDSSVVRYGTQAIKRYCEVAGLAAEDKVPEIFLGGAIATGIWDDLHLHSHVERYYTEVVKDLGKVVGPEIVNLVGGQRADVAVYSDGRPCAVIELKVFKDFQSPARLLADQEKLRRFSEICAVQTYLGVFITDTKNQGTCSERAQQLETALGKPFSVVGECQPSFDGKWGWRFASMKL